jgi:hypothetical protein
MGKLEDSSIQNATLKQETNSGAPILRLSITQVPPNWLLQPI